MTEALAICRCPVSVSHNDRLSVRAKKRLLGAARPTKSVRSRVFASSSEEVGLAHDAHELLLVDGVVAVSVGLVDHLLDLLVGHVLTELLGDALEVLEGDLAIALVVEETESLEHLLAGVSLSHLLDHHVEELGEVDDARVVLVDVGDHFLDFLTLGLEAESAHGDLELLLVDVARAVSVEEVKGLLDLLLLLFSEFSALLGASEGGLLV